MIKYDFKTGLYGLINKNGRVFIKYRTIAKINKHLFITSVFLFILFYYLHPELISIGWGFIDNILNEVYFLSVFIASMPFFIMIYKYLLYGDFANVYMYSIIKFSSSDEFHDNHLYINDSIISRYPKTYSDYIIFIFIIIDIFVSFFISFISFPVFALFFTLFIRRL